MGTVVVCEHGLVWCVPSDQIQTAEVTVAATQRPISNTQLSRVPDHAHSAVTITVTNITTTNICSSTVLTRMGNRILLGKLS